MLFKNYMQGPLINLHGVFYSLRVSCLAQEMPFVVSYGHQKWGHRFTQDEQYEFTTKFKICNPSLVLVPPFLDQYPL